MPVALVVVLGIIFAATSQKSKDGMKASPMTNSSNNSIFNAADGPIKLSVNKDFEYEPREINAQLGSTVKIEADAKTLVEGMDTVIIEGYGVRKLISPTDNIIEFAADKPGTYKIYCSNGMGNGKLIVK